MTDPSVLEIRKWVETNYVYAVAERGTYCIVQHITNLQVLL